MRALLLDEVVQLHHELPVLLREDVGGQPRLPQVVVDDEEVAARAVDQIEADVVRGQEAGSGTA